MVGNFSFVGSHSVSGPAAFPYRNVNSSPCNVSVMSLLHYNFLSRAAAKSMGVEPQGEWLHPWDLGSTILQGWSHHWKYNGGYFLCNLCKNGEVGEVLGLVILKDSQEYVQMRQHPCGCNLASL